MAREFFKDLPNTTTPLNASRLNGLLDGEEALGNIVVDSIRSKNMFMGSISQFNSTGGTGTTYRYFKLPKANTTYTLTLKAKTSFTGNGNTYLGFTGNGGDANNGYTWALRSNTTATTGQTITINNSGTYQYVSLFTNDENWALIIDSFDIQLEEGTTATNYMPYQNLDGKEIYSTGEKIVGTWIDGKPIYRKVISYTNSSTIGATGQVSNVNIPHGISNLGTTIDLKLLIGGIYPAPYLDGDGTKITKATWISRLDSTNVIFRIMNDTWSARTSYLILEYTKTTD